MMLSDYQDAVNAMGLTKTELSETDGTPAPVAFGYICAKRKANGGRRDDVQPNIGDFFGGVV